MHTAITDPESGEVLCGYCGLVISEKDIDIANPERRAFTTEETNQRTRTGAPTSLSRHDRGLSTIIGKPARDAAGHELNTGARSTYKRLKTWDDMQLHSSTNKNLQRAFSELYMLRDKLGLSDSLVEEIAYMYKKVEDKGLVRVANAAQLSERTTRRAFNMMSELLRKKTLTAGKDPMGLAASILYIAAKETGEAKNQRSMASAAGVTEVTVRNRIRALVKDLNLSTV